MTRPRYDRYDDIVDAITAWYPDCRAGKVFSMPCVKRSGRVVFGLSRTGMVFKLTDPDVHARALAVPGAHLFDPLFKSWEAERAGRGEWRSNSYNHKRIVARYGMSGDIYRQKSEICCVPRVGFRGIARNTDTRTMICSYIPAFPCGNSVLLMYMRSCPTKRLVLLQSFAKQ